jgi:N-formylglutamate amidohydrolase
MDRKLQTLSVFEIFEPPEITNAFVLNSPHSGTEYPQSFLKQTILSHEQLRYGEDTSVDKLFQTATPAGACFMKALFPRSFLDVNREAFELDPTMFEGIVPSFANTRSTRVAGGLGVIPRIIGEKTVIYNKKMKILDALERVDLYHKPYHQALQSLLGRVKDRLGMSVLLDCHSMPSSISRLDTSKRKDMILGNRFGTSCSPILVENFEIEAKNLGYAVTRNQPYAGGYITEHYGSPKTNSHALQIEINRDLYMNEKTLQLNDNFYALQADLKIIITKVSKLRPIDLAAFRDAAE